MSVAAYLLNAFAPSVEALKPYRGLSLFYYYIGSNPLVNGLDLRHVGVLVAVRCFF